MAPLVWLITGCSSGFGEQLVHSVLARGDRVIATGRNASEKLKHLEGTGASVFDLDVTLPPEKISKKIKEALGIYGSIDVLINNAGYVESSALEELSHERFMKSLSTNLLGPINLTKAILPHFRERNKGVIGFVGSLAGWRGDPAVSAYAATKFAIEGVAESLQKELQSFNSNIKVIVFEPGFFRTSIMTGSNIKYEQVHIPDYNQLYESSREFEAIMHGKQPGDPKKATERMVDVIKAEGMAAGRQLPLRLPLGADAYDAIKDKCETTLRLLEDWKDITVSTDFD